MSEPEPQITVFYDGACPRCVRDGRSTNGGQARPAPKSAGSTSPARTNRYARSASIRTGR